MVLGVFVFPYRSHWMVKSIHRIVLLIVQGSTEYFLFLVLDIFCMWYWSYWTVLIIYFIVILDVLVDAEYCWHFDNGCTARYRVFCVFHTGGTG